MSYASVADMIARFGADELSQLTDRDQGAAVIEQTVQLALDDATAQIDSYIAARYALPLAYVPAVLTRLCCDVARYFLHGNAATEVVVKRYEAATALLSSYAKGLTVLAPDLPGAPANQAGGTGGTAGTGAGGVRISTPGRVFSDGLLSRY